MTKSLNEIQQENRKLILEAVHGCGYEEALRKEIEFAGWSFDESKETLEHDVFTYRFKTTLNFALLALGKLGRCGTHSGEFHIWPDEIDFDYGKDYGTGKKYSLSWNLELETLEQQSEETQRAIWELLQIK